MKNSFLFGSMHNSLIFLKNNKIVVVVVVSEVLCEDGFGFLLAGVVPVHTPFSTLDVISTCSDTQNFSLYAARLLSAAPLVPGSLPAGTWYLVRERVLRSFRFPTS